MKYVLIVGNLQSDSKLYEICDSLVAGPFIGTRATRNPFNSGEKYRAWIYTTKFVQ